MVEERAMAETEMAEASIYTAFLSPSGSLDNQLIIIDDYYYFNLQH